MVQRPTRRPPPALDDAGLRALALAYAGRYATTQARLKSYLRRKLRERGWQGPGEPDIAAIVARMAELRYVDDQAFATARAAALHRRGFGPMRVRAALQSAGIDSDTSRALAERSDDEALDAAVRLARKRGFGNNPERRDKQLAALVRAGHGFAIARTALEIAGNPME